MSKTTVHAIILLLATLIIFFWVTNEMLASYSLQLTAVLLIILIVSRHLHQPSSYRLVESTISTMSVLLVVTATGGISSPLFFLNYFLLFELTLLLEPPVPIIVSLGLILFYFYAHQIGSSFIQLAALLSFPFMTPLAYLFGRIYQKEQRQKKEIRSLEKKVEKLEEEVVEDELKLHQHELELR